MPITADCHLHSLHSGDSDAPMEEMILSGIRQGLDTMCFTEHHDIDFPDSDDGPGKAFLLNTDSYLYDLAGLKEKYEGKINILFGVELGLQAEVFRPASVYAGSFPFDFVIGSSHICHGKDPYYPSFYEGRTEEEAYREYFESVLENVRKFSCFDVYGHLDYVVRYGPNRDSEYSYEKYSDILDKILKELIEREKGLEINTGGIKSGMLGPHPCAGILKRYRELGGEIVTAGSDAHSPDEVAAHFKTAADLLTECGFRYYTVFEKRTPSFRKL